MTMHELRKEILNRMHEILNEEHPSTDSTVRLMTYNEIMELTFKDWSRERKEEASTNG